ncbi:hypothetical protein CANINC_004126 [Pichia inconspicua]|uniref:Serine/threonine-protein phosphatase n=1 Tax=Pichia inconspicua TaxID=52247 RepID=A0A4V4NF97_9ASCO|nr:hypothetical protein CANINC_004126 [[Candida] inconspicua]
MVIPNNNDTCLNSSSATSAAATAAASSLISNNQDDPDPLPIQSSSLQNNLSLNNHSHIQNSSTPIPFNSSSATKFKAVPLQSSTISLPTVSTSSPNSTLSPNSSSSSIPNSPSSSTNTSPSTSPNSSSNINLKVAATRLLSTSPTSNENSRKQLSLKKYDHVDIDDIIERLVAYGLSKKSSKKFIVTPSEIKYICAKSRKIFMSQPMLLELAAPVKIVGDIHGQFFDLLRIFKLCGFPPSSNYLFTGDYVDRGKQSLETMVLLLCLKIKYPENFFLLRGNHETAEITKIYGFYDECKRRCSNNGVKIWKYFVDVFNTLPVAATIADKIFCVHGGLSPDLTNLNQIKQIQRPTDIPDEGLLADLLWSDPQDSNTMKDSSNNSSVSSSSPSSSSDDWQKNDRGVSYCFNQKVVKNFCAKFDFDLVARGHMVVEEGYEFYAKRKLVTIFSAPNYCGEFKNWGAVMNVNKKLMCSFELLKPKDKKK